MQIKLTTWNINSVRLRIDLVAKFLKAVRPDVLCLQETKCPDDAFPLKRFKRLGYEHIALNGQKGYHGVAVVSRLPLDSKSLKSYCGKTDCRHVGVDARREGRAARPADHSQLLCAGRRRRARPRDQSEVRAQARLPRRAEGLRQHAAGARRALHRGRRSQRRAARARRLEPQADAQDRLAHADRMREAHRRAEGRQLDRRRAHLRAASRKSSTPGGATARRTGSPPTTAAASTTSGCRRRSATGCRRSR